MKMRMVMIAALLAVQLAAVGSPGQAGDLPREEAAAPQSGFDAGADFSVEDGQADAAARAAAAQDEEPLQKKRKSTGDKLLTGAAVVLGVGALAVGGLLVAIFVG